MPRDSNGNYTLPNTVNPVLTGTTISSTWANTTLNDLATEMTDSLDRSGKGGMIAAFKIADGTVGAPGFAFVAEPTTGLYRIGGGSLGISIGGSNVATITSAGIAFAPVVTFSSIPIAPGLNVNGATVPANGIYLAGANTLGLSTNTTLRWSINASGTLISNFVGSSPGIDINNTSAALGQPALRLLNSSAGAQTSIDFFSNTVTLTGRLRNDSTSSMSYVAFSSGAHNFFVGGDFGAGVNATTITSAGILRTVDQSNNLLDVGWRDCPQNSQSVNYTCVLADRGKQMMTGTGGITFTIPSNASVAYPLGTVLVFCNVSGSNISIAINTDTMIWAGTGSTTGTRTLINSGVATAIKTQATQWLISGTGLG